MAGGTDLLVNLKRKVIKAKVVISLEKIKSLKQVHYSESASFNAGFDGYSQRTGRNANNKAEISTFSDCCK